jgi:predicted dinucleotide-binding enzyme
VLDRPVNVKESNMKKQTKRANDMRAEYDFSSGVRGKYAKRYAKGANVVLLAPDVAKVFPTAEAVNDSLRALAGILRRRSKSLVGR